MPWLETNVRDQRIQFVLAVQRGAPVTEACRAFGISRTTGHKWLRREAAAGSVAVLSDRSRRPQHSPRRTPPAIVKRLGEDLALQVHDELVFVVPECKVNLAKTVMAEEMCRRPSWAPGWPLAVDEPKTGRTYGEVK